MKIREYLEVHIEKYPYWEELNEKLIRDAELVEYDQTYSTNVKARKSDWQTRTPSVEKINDYVGKVLQGYYPWMKTVNVIQCWFANYNKYDYAIVHDHCGCDWSYVYFVKTPPGSSPLVFTTSGKRIKAEAGKIVIFPSFLQHHVPKNKCDGRITLAGNTKL